VRLEVDRQTLGLGEVLEVSVTISAEGSTSIGDYTPPRMPGFRRAGRTMQSSQVHVDPFTMRTEASATFTSTATAVQAGEFTIGPASVRLGGQVFRSNTVRVTVREGQGNPGSPPPGAPAPPPSADSKDSAGNASLFIDVHTSPQTVYVGQQLLAEWRLYTQIRIRDCNVVKEPQSDGFWSEDLETRPIRRLNRQNVQGTVYYTGTLLRKALYAQRSGKLEIGALEVQIDLPSRSFFFDHRETRRSKPVNVEVLPLPTAGQPKDFPPQNVGTFTIGATLDRTEVEVGQAAKLTLTVRGTGNLRQLDLPRLPRLSGIKVYEPKITDNPPKSVGQQGEKISEQLLVPTETGLVRIPPLVLDFFDPVRKQYRKLRTEEIGLRVTEPSTAGAAQAGDSETKTTQIIGRDIRPPRPARPLTHRAPAPSVDMVQLVLLALPLVGLLCVFGIEQVRERRLRPTARSRERAAARLVRQHLARATELKDGRDRPSLFAALTAAINGQLRHQMQSAVEGMTRAELQEAMARAGFDEELIEQTTNLLTRFEAERFTPVEASSSGIDETLEQTRQVVRRIAGTSVRSAERTGGKK
jgi:hypothetical protein